MGLRQLYFLLGGLLNRLVYLDIGLAVILGFIGVKLILEALHGEGVTWAPEIGIIASLAVIVVVLGVTTALSLLKVRRDPSAARQVSAPRPPPARVTPVPSPAEPAVPAPVPSAGDRGAPRAGGDGPAARSDRSASPPDGAARDPAAGAGQPRSRPGDRPLSRRRAAEPPSR
jgi:tellurite resistance protein TerC